MRESDEQRLAVRNEGLHTPQKRLRHPRQSGRIGVPRNPLDVTASTYKTEIYRTIGHIDAAEWDSIIGRNGILRSHAYLTAVESSGVDACEFFYPVVTNEAGDIVAHACVYTIKTDFTQLLPNLLKPLARRVRLVWPSFLQTVITECAVPLNACHSISVANGQQRRELITEISDLINEVATMQGSRLIVIRDFLRDERSDFDVLLEDNFNLVSNMPLARIKVRWKTYDEYLSCMRSRYRKDVNRRLKRAVNSGQKVHVLGSFGQQAALWAAQARTVFDKTKGFKREVLPENYYRNMDSALGERCILVAAERDSEIVAHGMVLHDDANTIATYFGRNSGPASQEWFQLVNEVIRIGIERQSEHINLGLGSYDAKSNVGADVEPLFVYAKSSIPLVNWLMNLVPKTMEPGFSNPKRVFRE